MVNHATVVQNLGELICVGGQSLRHGAKSHASAVVGKGTLHDCIYALPNDLHTGPLSPACLSHSLSHHLSQLLVATAYRNYSSQLLVATTCRDCLSRYLSRLLVALLVATACHTTHTAMKNHAHGSLRKC